METCYHVRITSDDLLTLRLTRDRLAQDLFNLRDAYKTCQPTRDREIILETLTNIITQCTTPAAAHTTATKSA